MRRRFEIVRFSTYTHKYCFAYMKCLVCNNETGRTIANATILNPEEKKIGDFVVSYCAFCEIKGNEN